MSLDRIGHPPEAALGIDLRDVPNGWLSRKGCVVFLLDRNYLAAFKVFSYSIRRALKRTDRDIVIMTTDEMVAIDGFCNAIADRVLFVDNSSLAAIASVRREKVMPTHFHPQFGKYAFLKLLCFDDLGYRDHIFLDVDMLCLDRRFRLDQIERAADFAAAITVGKQRLGLEGLEYSPQKLDNLTCEQRSRLRARFESLADASRKEITSFNSGVFYAGPRLLASGAKCKLIDAATKVPFALEQRVSLAVLSATAGLLWANLPLSLNVPVLPLYAIGRNQFLDVRGHVRILHYNGLRKPWQVNRHNADWLEKIWWDEHDAAMAWATSVEQYGPRAIKVLGVTRILKTTIVSVVRSAANSRGSKWV